ncbi:MAG: universal stress protein [Anderseniella sp.]|jgi:nucleotide-binding universal stress UspA family protein|nr:universal stress protein [Anderseniella sp.]
MSLFRKTVVSDRVERAVQKTLANVYAQRRKRFRILACIDDTEESFDTVRMAARLAKSDECDIIILFVRPIDQGLWSGGLQVRVARQNMLDSGLELPGVNRLRMALEILREEGIPAEDWPRKTGHQDAWGDPLGDNKVEFNSEEGRTVVLKLKTAPDPAAGILDQYELGPYNLIIMGEPSRWRGEFHSLFDAGVVQQVTVHAPCSVLVVRHPLEGQGFFICTDGSSRSMQAVRRAAVLAHVAGEPITLFSAARDEVGLPAADENVKNARALLKAMGIKVKDLVTAAGPPAEMICQHGAGHGVIVVTDEGRTRLQRMIRGSTAVDVVRKATTSVLDVR